MDGPGSVFSLVDGREVKESHVWPAIVVHLCGCEGVRERVKERERERGGGGGGGGGGVLDFLHLTVYQL